jgi:hypothetical protein
MLLLLATSAITRRQIECSRRLAGSCARSHVNLLALLGEFSVLVDLINAGSHI